MSDRIARQFGFLAQTDRLKPVDRVNVLMVPTIALGHEDPLCAGFHH
mgnify:CR=1 FL=1